MAFFLTPVVFGLSLHSLLLERQGCSKKKETEYDIDNHACM